MSVKFISPLHISSWCFRNGSNRTTSCPLCWGTVCISHSMSRNWRRSFALLSKRKLLPCRIWTTSGLHRYSAIDYLKKIKNYSLRALTRGFINYSYFHTEAKLDKTLQMVEQMQQYSIVARLQNMFYGALIQDVVRTVLDVRVQYTVSGTCSQRSKMGTLKNLCKMSVI